MIFPKRLRRLQAGAILLIALLCCGCEKQPRLSPLAADAVVLAFGDSLTRGTGAGDGPSYPQRLQALTGRRVVNAGIPGELSAEGLRRLPSALERHRPDLLILCHGGNDLLRRRSPEKTAANIREMVRIARDQGVEVVLIGVPQFGFGLETAPFYREIAEEMSLPFEGDILVDILGERDLKSDTIHPNAEGYRQMARAVADLLQEAGAI